MITNPDTTINTSITRAAGLTLSQALDMTYAVAKHTDTHAFLVDSDNDHRLIARFSPLS